MIFQKQKHLFKKSLGIAVCAFLAAGSVKTLPVPVQAAVYPKTAAVQTAKASKKLPKISIQSITPKPGGCQVTWKKSGRKVDGYLVCYSRTKKGKVQIKRVRGGDVTSTRITGLKNQRVYYVAVRSYKKAGGTLTYSAWSKKAKGKSGPTAYSYARALKLKSYFQASLAHGSKGAQYQKYIVLHDTEGISSPEDIIDGWVSDNAGVGAHFVVGRDGRVVQCLPLDQIAHHAGFGDAGHNRKFGVEDESRDDKKGTSSIGSDYPDYGMNSYSIGIEMVHQGETASYPEAQLKAVDRVIGYIDAYYGFDSIIIDHKTWRTTNSDTSPAFAAYLENYQKYRKHLAE